MSYTGVNLTGIRTRLVVYRCLFILTLLACPGLGWAQDAKPAGNAHGQTDISGDWRCISSGMLTGGTATKSNGNMIFTRKDEMNYIWTSSIVGELKAPEGQIFRSSGTNIHSVTMSGSGTARVDGDELTLWTKNVHSTDYLQNIYQSTSKYRISEDRIVHVSTTGIPELESYSSTCTR